jgi:NADP-dependent 3-hydroxy acid dehydrogenase YdfG
MFSNQVIIITGASSGIGAALARLLASQGAKVSLAARDAALLQQVQADCPGSLAIPTDVTDPQACQTLVAQTVAHFGCLDTLVNNAGVSMLSRFDDLQELSVLEKLMQVNYFGAVYCTRAALPHLRQSCGLLVGISSLAGKTGVPYRTGYSASKHAMQGFFDSLRIELIGSGVEVCMVSPGFVQTEIRQHSFGQDGQALGHNPLQSRRLMSAEECARQIAQAMQRRQRELLMETKGRWLMWGKLLAPRWVDWLTRRSADHS